MLCKDRLLHLCMQQNLNLWNWSGFSWKCLVSLTNTLRDMLRVHYTTQASYFHTLCPVASHLSFFSKGHSESSSREHVWRSCQKSSHAMHPLASPFGTQNNVIFLCCCSKLLMQHSVAALWNTEAMPGNAQHIFFFFFKPVGWRQNKDNKAHCKNALHFLFWLFEMEN